MNTVFSLQSLPDTLRQGTCVTIGNFDGVHLGHQALIRRLVEVARAERLPAVLVTFDPHPQEVLRGGEALPRITTPETRLALFESLGVDIALVLPFTRELSELTPADFVQQVLVNALHTRALIVGHDFSLGRQRAGNAAQLAELAAAHGFAFEQLPPVTAENEAVSSSRIRSIIRDGRVEALPALLGRPYTISGIVEHGFRRGSTLLGFPTANIGTRLLLPATGTYAVRARLPEAQSVACLAPPDLLGVANIGCNPTFNTVGAAAELTLEVHLLDFSQDIYGQPACVTFLQRLRDERRFSGPEVLVAQITQDIEQARKDCFL